MAKKKGRVASISRDGWAKVITERGDACNNCEASQFCHSIADCSRLEARVLNPAAAAAGDLVFINLSSMTVLKGALILYILPTAGLLFGAFAGAGLSQQLGIGETVAEIAGGFAGLVLGFIAGKFISQQQAARNKLTPVITRIIRPAAEFHPSKIPAGHGYK